MSFCPWLAVVSILGLDYLFLFPIYGCCHVLYGFPFAVDVVSQFPGLSHHDAEVFVGIDGSRDVLVVIAKFVKSNDAVGDLGVPHAHELAVSLLGGLLAIHNIWVLANIVDASYIIQRDLTISINVKLVVS